MHWIDLRSDTVTPPTPAMRRAMAEAEVGDDVYGDDPTVQRLEELACELLGKDAALFVPSGTFGNQLALFTHCQPGDEVICGEDSHLVWHEVGAAAVIAGANLRPVPTQAGELGAEAIRPRIRPPGDIHLPKTALIALENAHSNGRALPLAGMQAVRRLADEKGIAVHLDGARLFNAAVALNEDPAALAACADSVMVCLSKGLAAPVGSLLLGSRDFIELARKKRKLLGGGLRQVGILAAAGLLGLTDMRERLQEDHANARLLAGLFDGQCGITVLHDQLDINLVWCRVPDALDGARLAADLLRDGIKINPPEDGLLRLVTHWAVSAEQARHSAQRLLDCIHAQGIAA
ncbi:threonine aldolase family protein [Chitinilyticum piscinae]|uniref:DegT/DnrJ/EryC1/StrS family aminotransferase n=1 Tax=Chitinilyticum piscinae TaxID=2866724 RepID=A0A8J7FF88_9NEIS|nr:GntG family PLP-dependent aldolase [Chitinilyticum piscinae]MBE9608298.1 DegT/DnrJ/EryC1/StrS family aminotransferase [Chitinilyticum piscinae]